MKKILLASTMLATLSAPVIAEEIKVGIILGFTGPIESLTPSMADGAELALSEASKSGNLFDGNTVSGVRGDSTCIDSAAVADIQAARQGAADRGAGRCGAAGAARGTYRLRGRLVPIC